MQELKLNIIQVASNAEYEWFHQHLKQMGNLFSHAGKTLLTELLYKKNIFAR